MNGRVPKDRLVTSKFNDIFLKIYPYDPISKFQELEIGSSWTCMQIKIKICKTDFSQTEKMWNFAYFKNNSKSVLHLIFNILALNAIHP